MFILDTKIKDKTICDKLITFHKQSESKRRGSILNKYGNSIIDLSVKDSIDVAVNINSGIPIVYEYFKQLETVVKKYIKKYPMCAEYASWGMVESMNIQYYKPGGGYTQYHTEHSSKSTGSRHLAWMTYLNDVYWGGETQFYHQRKKIRPRKGRTLIWPVDWTYTHRGISAPWEEKYIITGWLNYF